MIINHNINVMKTVNKLKTNQRKTNKTVGKLSSGLRITQASDDAAGLAISEKMRSQIRGLHQAERNIQDGISLIQTGESGLCEIGNNLQRVRELCVQASNGTLTEADRLNISKEIGQIKSEIDNIADNTEFNGIKLLSSPEIKIHNEVVPKEYDFVEYKFTRNPGKIDKSVFDKNSVDDVNYIIIDEGDGDAYAKNEHVIFTFGYDGADGHSTSNEKYYNVEIGATIQETLNNFQMKLNAVKDSDSNLKSLDTFVEINNNKMTIYCNEINSSGFHTHGWSDGSETIELGDIGTISDDIRLGTSNSINLQVGSNYGDIFPIKTCDVRVTSLGLENLQIKTCSEAQTAIDMVDSVIKKISSDCSRFGAYENSLEHILKNALNYRENIVASKSRVRDVDMVKEMMNFQKNNILQQVAQSMLAQANQQPQGVLQLLR